MARDTLQVMNELDEAKTKRNALNLKLHAELKKQWPNAEDDSEATTGIRASLVSIQFDIIQLQREYDDTFPSNWRRT